ncbi:MAG TPA: GatB/YqeY domain-containing protein [Bacteroidales bacterium]|nr:GatB/YqeY domain-containing protein [Bacteroidales bacterium]
MKVSERIDADIRAAMLAREKEKLEALRAIKAAILLARTEKGGSDQLTEDTEVRILRKLISQREEAATIYKQQNRQDLYQKEVNEAGYISAYLPAMMAEDEVVSVIRKIISETGASSQADFGKVMGLAARQLAGKADNKVVSAKIREILG